MIEVLSLGAGVQSTTVFHRAGRGELPHVDVAIFSDTQWEPQAVYDHLDELINKFSPKYGIPIEVVTAGNLREDAMVSEGKRWASMPLYTKQQDKESKGMIKRQCTAEYKIQPIERYIKTEVLELPVRSRWPKEQVVRQWFGISTDEVTRISYPTRRQNKRTKVKGLLQEEERVEVVEKPIRWKSNYYPLIGLETFSDKRRKVHREFGRMTRADCLRWMEEAGLPQPPRSACIGCPYHSNEEWRRIKENPQEWEDAVEFDERIRDSGGTRGQCFLHRSCQPLVQIDFNKEDEGGFFGDECEGMCGV